MTWKTRPRSDLGSLVAIVEGRGPVVLLIHGVGLRAEAWGAQLDALARQSRVIAVDMPGHGDSPRLPDSPQLADFTDAIAATLTGPAVVIGHSLGAMIALDLAARYPRLVQAVAALNAIFQRDDAAKAAVQARADTLAGTEPADPAAPLTRWFGTEPSPAREACQRWLSETGPAGYRDAYRVFADEDGPAPQTLQDLHCPAVFVTGADEPNSTPAMSHQMAKLAPQGRAEIIGGAAHMMPMTHPAEVNAILSHFIQDHAA